MPSYDTSRFSPPAPIAQVTLRDLSSGALFPNVLLLIDTGADITLLPRGAVEKLGVKFAEGDQYQLQSFDGTITTAHAVELDMIFLNKAYRGKYLLTEDSCGVLGRDVLSSLALLFDGPRQEWSEHKSG